MSPYRPSPMVDPSTFTPEALDSRGQENHRFMNGSSSVVRSNSLRSNSPPQVRRYKPQPPQLPPVPESADDRFAMMHISTNQHPPQPSPTYPQPPQFRQVPPVRPPSRPVSEVPPNADDSSVVPGGTSVISGYDPATVRAMNLSR